MYMISAIRLREILDSNGSMLVRTGRNGRRKNIGRNLLILWLNGSLRMTWMRCAHVMLVCWCCPVDGLPTLKLDGSREKGNQW